MYFNCYSQRFFLFSNDTMNKSEENAQVFQLYCLFKKRETELSILPDEDTWLNIYTQL